MGIAITVAMLIAAGVWGYWQTPSGDVCKSITYILDDGQEREYVFRNELEAILNAEDIHPVGRPTNHLSLQRIENAIRRHPMVRTAECYITPWHEVRVNITQRVPLLRVETAAETYFIDTDRRVMQARPVVKDKVLRVTGAVGPQLASTQLADFTEWLQHNKYWRERISYVHMRTPRMAVLVLRDASQPRIVMGSIQGYERKLNKLRTFFEHGQEALKEKHYEELDIRFRGQVIGRGADNN